VVRNGETLKVRDGAAISRTTDRFKNMTEDTKNETSLEFPCEFPVKAMGLATDDFDALVVEIVRRHVTDFGEDSVRSRFSRKGKYVSVTVNIMATSQAQLDAIYQDLSDHERVVMAL